MPICRRHQALLCAGFCISAHLCAMVRTTIPSQDGIKFIQIARQFGHQPVWDVIRSADQHPLYPATVAMAHWFLGPLRLSNPAAWRVAAQSVSLVAGLFTLWPLFRISQRLFGDQSALLAVFFWLVLPLPMSIGHETLSDSLALCLSVWALHLGLCLSEVCYWQQRLALSVASGTCVALAYWTRPEGVLAAFSIISAQLIAAISAKRSSALFSWRHSILPVAAFSTIVGAALAFYSVVNGSMTDRLAGLASPKYSQHVATQAPGQNLPRGLPLALRDSTLDFSPKDPQREVRKTGLKAGHWQILREWSESLGMALAVMTLWGIVRTRTIENHARILVRIHSGILLSALVYQSSVRGYLSERHVLMLTFLSLPFAASGVRLCSTRLADLLSVDLRKRKVLVRNGLSAIMLVGVWQQNKPAHESRMPHRLAGQWLTRNTSGYEAVFDTRGWASFEADLKRYDPYHMPQALSDSSTRYFVVEAGELQSGSLRSATLSKIIDDGGRLMARFRRDQSEGSDDQRDVLVFAWHRPSVWDIPVHEPIANKPITEDIRRDENFMPVQFSTNQESVQP